MAKKRRQSDPQSNGSESSSDDNEKKDGSNASVELCSHLKKSVDIQKLRKPFKLSSIELEKCAACAKEDTAELVDGEFDKSLWMCLKCGTHLCGRSVNKHALVHFQTPRSDPHAIALNTTT